MKMHRQLHIRWQSVGLSAFIIAGMATLLSVGTTNIAPRLTPGESAATIGGGFHAILTNPLHLPLKLLQWLVWQIPTGQTLLLIRMPSIILAVTGFCTFLYIVRRWYGRRSMVFGGVLLATSAWFLHLGRFAGTDIESVAALLVLLAAHIGLYDHDDRPLMAFGWLLLNLVLLFIPGFVWFVLLGAAWQWRAVVMAWRKMRPVWLRLPWVTLAAFGIAAVTYVLIIHSDLLRSWLGMPAVFPPAASILNHVGNSFTALVWRAPHSPEIWLDHLPLLDLFTTAMLVAGCAFYARHWRAPRTRLLASFLLVGGILAGLGVMPLGVTLPVVYIVITGGVAYALHFWLRRFPRNPLARGAGIGILALLALVSCSYNLSQYFIAWPHNPETKAVFSANITQQR